MVDKRSKGGKKSIPRASPARRGTIRLTLVLGALVLVNCYVFLWRDHTSIPAVMKQAETLGDKPVQAVADREPELGPDEAAPPPDATTVIDGEVAKGDTLGRLLKNSGLAASDADEVLRAMSQVFDMKSLRPGQKFRIERNPDGTVRSFELVISRIKTVRVARDADGLLVGAADEAETRIEAVAFGGRIDHSLYASIKAAGEDTSLVAFFVDVFSYDIDFFTDTHPGDTFRVLVEKEYKDQEFLRYKRIIAAEYEGKVGTFRVFAWQGAAKAVRYYDEKGRSIEKTLLKTPLKFSRISSGFNRKRMHPILHRVRGHMGTDYAAPVGTPVWAAASGTIVKRGPQGGAGNIVILKHDDGQTTTQYMHLSKYASGQKVGDHVAVKTVIGYVGMTGLATGPHLHFGVIQNGVHVDPQKLVPTRARGVPVKEIPAFKKEAGSMIDQLKAIVIATPVTPIADSDDDAEEVPLVAPMDAE
jgi:murein DD-endopeptidase MepM/ murein hydrolase activator NlpD